jgi:hypothetical protein
MNRSSFLVLGVSALDVGLKKKKLLNFMSLNFSFASPTFVHRYGFYILYNFILIKYKKYVLYSLNGYECEANNEI